MNELVTINATVGVWMSEYHTPAELMECIEKGDTARAVGILTLYGQPTMESFGNYARMGEADVTLRLLPKDEQVRLAVKQLQGKLEELRSAYMERQQQILAQISKLQALDYVEAE